MREALSRIAGYFSRAGLPLYLVGGSVRNPLLGLPASDLDVCSPATPEVVESILVGTQVSIKPRARFLGTLQLLWQHEGRSYAAEFTSFRSDAYRSGHVPAQVVFTRDMRVDALRRDFRCNAVYRDADTWVLADPVDGLADIEGRMLRAVHDDPHQVLKDDGLRLLRMVRFAGQLGFATDGALWQEAQRQISILADITPERQMEELHGILLCDTTYPTLGDGEARLARALCQLEELGALTILFPQLPLSPEDLRRCAAVPASHAFPMPENGSRWKPPVIDDAFLLPIRLAALFAEKDPARVETSLTALRFSTEVTEAVTGLCSAYQAGLPEDASFLVAKLGVAQSCRLALLYLAAEEESQGKKLLHTLHVLQEQQSPTRPSELALSGEALLALLGDLPRQHMGPLLAMLWQHVLQHPRDDTPETLRSLALAYLTEEQRKGTSKE